MPAKRFCKPRTVLCPRVLSNTVCAAQRCHLIHVSSDELPEHFQHEFAEVKWNLTKDEPKGTEGSTAATVARLTAGQQQRVAMDILSLYRSLVKLELLDC